MDTSNMYFVFGSNRAGIHGAGAAKFAREKRGARLYVGEGRTGQSYALPTKEGPYDGPLPLYEIKQHVNRFLNYARSNPDFQFQVTCVGCGLAGLQHADVAPMFRDAPLNCYFDRMWMGWLGMSPDRFWGTF